MTCNPPETATWEARLALEGLQPLGRATRSRHDVRQNPLRDQVISEREQQRLRILAEILTDGSSRDGRLTEAAAKAVERRRANGLARGDARLAQWVADGRRPVDLPCWRYSERKSTVVYERLALVRELAAAVVFGGRARRPRNEAELRAADILDLFAEAQWLR